MTISEIKAVIAAETGANVGTLMFQNQKTVLPGTTTEVATEWYSHWCNVKRVRVAIHQQVLDAIKADPLRGDLIKKSEAVPAEADRAAYTRVILAIPRELALVI